MNKRAPTHRPMPHLARVHAPAGARETYGQGRGGRPWRRKRAQVLKRDGYLCQCDECKAEGRLLLADEVDHVVPLAQGGTDDENNLRAINRRCHQRKTAREAARGRARAR